MFRSIKTRWTITALIVACVFGLALLGGNWRISRAETIPTIPTTRVFSISPTWVKLYQGTVLVDISWQGTPIAFPAGYTYITFDQVGGAQTHLEFQPDIIEANRLVGVDTIDKYLPGTVMGKAGLWKVQVVLRHLGYQGMQDEYSNIMTFVVGSVKTFLPTILTP
jgi:hypothetical protein